MRYRHHLPLLLMLLILLVAAAVRFHMLDAQSLWYDEGVAFGHSQRSIFELIPALQNNVHVPAYFGSLALWEDFVGATEFGLRSYSALWSILSVAVTYALGKRLFSPVAGLAAAAFVALNTFSIYYAQETRMYAMLAAVGGLSMWVFVGMMYRLSKPVRRLDDNRNLFEYALVLAAMNTLGAYTHYSYALVMLSQGVLAVANLAWIVWRYRQPYFFLRAFQVYAIANVIMLVLFAPWLSTALSQVSAQPNISVALDPAELVRILQGWLTFGITFDAAMGGMNVVVYMLLLFGLILLPTRRERSWWVMLLPVVWVILSVAIYWMLDLNTRYLRFLLPAQIGVALWMGRGIWVLWRMVPRSLRGQAAQEDSRRDQIVRYLPRGVAVFSALALCFALARGLNPLYHDPAYQRDDYRSLAAEISQQATANDAVILNAPGLQEIFGYYYAGEALMYPLPQSADIAADTQAVINGHERIFTVLYGANEQDAQGLVVQTLQNSAYPIDAQWVGDVQWMRHLAQAEFEPAERARAVFGDSIRLRRYALNNTEFEAGEVLAAELEWFTTQPLDVRYKVFLQLLNEDGALVVQRDSEPIGGLGLTTLWPVDEIVLDRHALLLPDDLPAGTYKLIVGLYDANPPNARLPISDGDFLLLDTITITD